VSFKWPTPSRVQPKSGSNVPALFRKLHIQSEVTAE